MAMWVWERERKRMLRCNSADRGCVACSGQHHVAGNGADFSPVLALETVYGTEEGSKANDNGVSRWCSFPHAWWILPSPCESAVRLYRVGLILQLNQAASSFDKGGVVECSSRVTRKCYARFLEGWARVITPGYSAYRQLTVRGLSPR